MSTICVNPSERLSDDALQALLGAAETRGLVRSYATLDGALLEMAPANERARMRAIILELWPVAATAVITHALVPPTPGLGCEPGTTGTMEGFPGTLPDGRDVVVLAMVMDPDALATVARNRRRRGA